jgi:hypothetical protein
MKKILIALMALMLGLVSCLKNDPYEPPQTSTLKGVLFINEVNGTGKPYATTDETADVDGNKYVELYNSGNTEIDLTGFILDYGGSTTWTGSSGQKIPAHGYFVLKGTKSGTYPGSGNMMSTGLSANNANVNLTLFDNSGASIDYYEKVADLNDHATLKSKVHQRIPDGGKWYYTQTAAATKDAANPSSSSASGVLEEMPPMELVFTVELESVTPTMPTPDDNVTLVVKVTDVNAISAVVLKWKKNTVDQTDVNITASKSGSNYTANIAKQADGTVVDWTIEATNEKGAKASKSGTITFAVPAADYSNLVLNEINGTGQPYAGAANVDGHKYYELFNKSNQAIPLEGVTIHYDNGTDALTWTGTSADVIAANGYFAIVGRTTQGGVLLTGLSANSPIKCTLYDPQNNSLDVFEKVTNTSNSTDQDQCFQRIPDGIGIWYYTPVADASKGTANPSAVGTYKQITPSPAFGTFTKTPSAPTTAEDVTVKITVTDPVSVGSVVLYTTIGGGSPTTTDITSTAAAGVYTGTIPKQAADVKAYFYVVAQSSVNPTLNYSTSKTDSVTFTGTGAPSNDYTKLKFNEISGVGGDADKFYELINLGTEPLSLTGVRITYNNTSPFNSTTDNDTWVGATGTIAAGARLLLQGRITAGGVLLTGLSAGANITCKLFAPDNTLLDQFDRRDWVSGGTNTKAFAKIPEGTGAFYYADATAGTANPTSTGGLNTVTPGNYKQLVINEVDGNGKFVEIYNNGTSAISLEGVILRKNESATWWTGGSTASIAAGGHYTIVQSGQTTVGADEYTGASGISASKTVKFELTAPNSMLIDAFARVKADGALDIACTPDYSVAPKYSFSRCPDGTGAFGLAVPSCNTANPATAVGPIVTN